MNYPLVTVTINDTIAYADRQICLFVGDANVQASFKVVNRLYKRSGLDEDDYLAGLGATSCQINIEKQGGGEQIQGVATTIADKTVTYTFTSAITTAGSAGTYDYQIILQDPAGNAILTLPPVIGGIVVKERLF